MGERVYPLIPEFHKFADIDLLQVNELSKEAPKYGNIDYRDIFNKKYLQYVDKIYNIPINKEYPQKYFTPSDVKKYDLIFFDEVRMRYGLKLLYKHKREDCIMVANTHCNSTLNPKTNNSAVEGHSHANYISQGHKKIFDFCFVHGETEKKAYGSPSHIISGGIPSNDALKDIEITNKHILIVVNFLGHAPVCPYKVRFNKDLFNKMNLLKLQKKYNKKIVIKTKSRRIQSKHYTKDHEYIKSILPKELDYEIITDYEDNNKLICDSFLVIGSTSTLCFKPIQKGIPTILINKAGTIGSFYNYRSLIDIDENFLENVDKEISYTRDKSYIDNILEGGSTYSSTEVYVKNIKKLLNI